MKVPFVDLKTQYDSIKEAIENAVERVILDTVFISWKYLKPFESMCAISRERVIAMDRLGDLEMVGACDTEAGALNAL